MGGLPSATAFRSIVGHASLQMPSWRSNRLTFTNSPGMPPYRPNTYSYLVSKGDTRSSYSRGNG